MQLGVTARDKITNLEGVVIGHCTYITGCSQALVQPRGTKEGEFPESRWIDVQRLEVLPTQVLVLDNGSTPGFDRAPPRI